MRAKYVPHPAQQHYFSWDAPSPALTAKLRMAQLPHDARTPANDQTLFVDDSLWVPVSVVNGNVYILPGVPRLFAKLVDGLRPLWLPRVADPDGRGTARLLFSTPLPESEIAAYLAQLAAAVAPRGLKVGSYPRWGKSRNTVTLVGRDKAYMESLVGEVERGIRGTRIDTESDSE
jgi:molybdopterin-biosynthesis enzyme MoeA-like protein